MPPKFPLRERPFSRVEPTPTQCAEYERVTHAVLAATMDEYDDYAMHNQRTMNKKQWKPVKSREDVTVYKRISESSSAPAGAATTHKRRQPAELERSWRLPKLVGVGTIAGTLGDIMYGIVTPDAPSIVVKTSYVNDELLDSAVLHTLRHATQNDPYQFLGLKWMAMGHSATINAVVWPRDFVFVEATGLTTLPNTGDRVGFHVMHSVAHPQCHELTSSGIIRGHFSSCYLYKEHHRAGTVEIYMTTYGDPGGNPPETVAILSATNTAIGCWKSMWCAQNKKLTWLLQNATARHRFRSLTTTTTTPTSDRRDRACCRLCSKTIRSFRSAVSCQLCAARVCSRCRVARKLSYSDEELQLTQHVVEICKNCMIRATNDDAFRIAREQYVGVDSIPSPVSTTRTASQQRAFSASSSSATSALSSSSRPLKPLDDMEPVELLPTESPSDVDADLMSFAKLETIDDWERQSTPLVPSKDTATAVARVSSTEHDGESLESHHQRLLMQMQTLCRAAEQTYHITSMTGSHLQEKPTRLMAADTTFRY